MKKRKQSQSLVGNMLNTGIASMVGIGLVGATSSAVSALPAGTAKTIAGITPGLQSVALLGPNLKLVKSAFPKSKKKKIF